LGSQLYRPRSTQARLKILPFARSLSLLKAFILASAHLHLLLARAYRDDGKADDASSGKPERYF